MTTKHTKAISLFLFALVHLSASAGEFFNVSASGSAMSADVTLCLNSEFRLGCQVYHTTAADLSIRTTVPGKTYTTAGVKSSSTGFRIDSGGSACETDSEGFCAIASVSDTTPSSVKVQVEDTYTIGGTITGLTANGLILQNNSGDDLTVASGATSFEFSTAITRGTNYSVTISQQPTGLSCTLSNASGTNVTDNISNVTTTCVPATGLAKCWGRGAFGNLGYGDTNNRGDGANEMGDNLATIDVGSGRTVKALATGLTHVCAILDNDTVKCWGQGTFGSLGYGDTLTRGDGANEMGDNLPTVNLGSGRTAKKIAAGNTHTCAILDNDTVKCWGRGSFGRLGYGDTSNRGSGPGQMADNLPVVDLGTGRTAKEITTGDTHTCVILDNDTVKCWGEGSFGRLGYGNTNNRGDGTDAGMGDNLPAVDLGTGRAAKVISGGHRHTCAILDNDTVKCWGYGNSGRLGYGNTNNRGDGTDAGMGDNLPAVDLGTGRTAQKIELGNLHTCALLDNDTVKCWGANTFGQLGYGDTTTRGSGGGQMGNNLAAVDLGTGRTAQTIVVGYYFSCALLDDDTNKCWGYNNSGELGYGDTTNRGDGPNEMGNNLPAIDLGSMVSGFVGNKLSAGGEYNCALIMN